MITKLSDCLASHCRVLIACIVQNNRCSIIYFKVIFIFFNELLTKYIIKVVLCYRTSSSAAFSGNAKTIFLASVYLVLVTAILKICRLQTLWPNKILDFKRHELTWGVISDSLRSDPEPNSSSLPSYQERDQNYYRSFISAHATCTRTVSDALHATFWLHLMVWWTFPREQKTKLRESSPRASMNHNQPETSMKKNFESRKHFQSTHNLSYSQILPQSSELHNTIRGSLQFTAKFIVICHSQIVRSMPIC